MFSWTSVLFLLCLIASVVSISLDPENIKTPTVKKVPISLEAGNYSKRAGALYLYVSIALQDIHDISCQLASAYSFSLGSTAGQGKKVAIVVAYGGSTTEADLQKFNNQWSLATCTTSSGCFHKLDQTGGTNYPPDDTSSALWGFYAAQSVQAVHAMAQGATIYLICCKSPNINDLMIGVQTAVGSTIKANYVVMIWGLAETSALISTYDPYFLTTSSFFAMTGDAGAGSGISQWYPATSSKVTAVGGTSLYTLASTYAYSSEQGWAGSGGGCSAYVTATTSQSSKAGYSALGCGTKKAVPELSMDADPNSGLIVYYSGYVGTSVPCSSSCWYQGEGTELATALIGGRAASRAILTTPASVYTGGYSFRDITVGSNNAHSCSTGIDLVTGVGSLLG